MLIKSQLILLFGQKAVNHIYMNNNKQLILGIIGGLGPEVDALFIKAIRNHTVAETDQDHICIKLLSDPTIPDRINAVLSNDPIFRESIVDKFNAILSQLGDVEAVAIPCNTSMHFINSLKSEAKIINIVDETVKAVKEKASESTKIGIMATDGALHAGLYHNALKSTNLVPVSPGKDMQAKIMEIIFRIKQTGKGREEDFNIVLEHLLERGCKYVIIGNTELSYFSQNNSLPQCIDSLTVLAKVSIETVGKKYKEFSPSEPKKPCLIGKEENNYLTPLPIRVKTDSRYVWRIVI